MGICEEQVLLWYLRYVGRGVTKYVQSVYTKTSRRQQHTSKNQVLFGIFNAKENLPFLQKVFDGIRLKADESNHRVNTVDSD